LKTKGARVRAWLKASAGVRPRRSFRNTSLPN
jgi:hypothetical protein